MLGWLRGIGGILASWTNPQGLYGARPALPTAGRGRPSTLSQIEMYRVLRAYYGNNGMYDVLRDVLRRQGIAAEALKPLRNPSYRVVEFHAGHLWPGTIPDALPIQTDHDKIIAPIHQVWQWSNWNSTKQVAARHLPLYGDYFLKVAETEDRSRVFFQLIEPEHVTDFDADERDFITYVRMDVPMSRRNDDGSQTPYMHTETWSKSTGLYRLWEHDQDAAAAITDLGQPKREAEIASFGINFIPVVHAKFSDIGEDRGMGALVPALDKIDEANREATRLAQLVFRHNDVLWALRANAVTGDNRPLPAPRITETDGTTDDDGTITLGGDRLLRLPGLSSLESLVPNINYEAALNILNAQMTELEQDLPELVLYRLSETGQLSGRAVRLMLAPAIARLSEARGNAESALIRANQMALTIGTNAGLWNVGTFEEGDFEHGFEERDVLPNDELERAQAQQADAQALQAYTASGVPVELAVQYLWGWSEERAEQFTKDRLAAIQREQQLATEDVTEPVAQ